MPGQRRPPGLAGRRSGDAAVTRRARLVTCILIAPLRETASLAKQVASVDVLSGGRVTLGMAVGAREDGCEISEIVLRRSRRSAERSARGAAPQQAAYRIVQESLTNVIRHASAATATVTLGYGNHDVSVEVADTGAGVRPTSAARCQAGWPATAPGSSSSPTSPASSSPPDGPREPLRGRTGFVLDDGTAVRFFGGHHEDE